MVKDKLAEDNRQKFIEAATAHGADVGSAEVFRQAVRDVAERVKETKRTLALRRKTPRWPKPR